MKTITEMTRELGGFAPTTKFLEAFAALVFEQGRQEGTKQERALWELSKLGQEIEAQPERDPWREALAQPDNDPWREAVAQPEERNFCQCCGKRTADLTAIHTCTPPQPEQELVATVIKRGGYRQWHCLALSQLPDGTYTFYGKRSQRTPPQIDPNQWAFDGGLEST